MENTTVVIVGLGAAGVTAVNTLLNHDVTNFIVLEGLDRIGGRLYSCKTTSGVTIELGAEQIHAVNAKDNPIWLLAKKYNLATKPCRYEEYTVRNSFGENQTEMATKGMRNLEAASKFAHIMGDSKRLKQQPDLSYRTALRLGGWHPSSTLQKLLEVYKYDFDYADAPDCISVKHDHIIDDGDVTAELEDDVDVIDDRGFAYILQEYLCEKIDLKDPRIHLQESVLSIDYSGSKLITKTGNKTYASDCVILTVSIGVLQSGKISFNPPLLESKLLSIHECRSTAYTKVVVRYSLETPIFWDQTEYILYESSRRGYFSIWKYPNAHGEWPQGANILIAYVTGEEGERISRSSVEHIKAEVNVVLQNMYGADVPDAEEVIITRWIDDPLFGGSYVLWTPELSTADVKSLKAPLGGLYFAGEAYDKYDWQSVQGAMQSGKETAKKVCKHLKSI